MPGTLDLSVIIVSWNVCKPLQDCLESIFSLPLDEQPKEVFVVDNASTDETLTILKQHYPQVVVIANAKNCGFAAANNQAIEKCTSANILLLNPDTVVHPGAFPRLLRAFIDHPQAGIVGPKLLNADGSIQPSVRRLPTFGVLCAIALKLTHIWKSFPPFSKYLAKDLDPEKEQVVGQVMGAAFLIRRLVIEKVGVLDEGFHVWFEEVDYCKRAADAGWETWYVPQARITHLGGQSFGQLPSVEKQRQWSRSVQWYSHKHFSKVATSFLHIAGYIGLAATAVAAYFQRHAVARLVAIPVLLALLTGLASFRVGLLSDDWDWYYEGRMTQQEVTRPLTHNVGGAFYRPLATYSYALDYAVSPYNIPVARTQQLILFIATVILLVVFVWQITGQAWVATASGIFFSLWPQHHEVTTWLGSRPDLLTLLWLLAALVTFTSAIRRNQPVLYFLTLFWAAAAILSKETGVLIIPALFLVALMQKRLRERRVWLTIIGSGIIIVFFLYIRSLVLGQLIGGYGDSQTQVGFVDIKILFLSTIEGWLNWSWLSAKFPANTIKIIRYVVVAVLGLGFISGLVKNWRVFLKHWRALVMLIIWFVLAISISLPMLQSVRTMNLNGTRYLYLASSVFAVGLAVYISLIKARKKVAILFALVLAIAWLVNLQPWQEASAENNNILSQLRAYVPNPPQDTVFSVRGLPGDRYGAFQWYARRSLPEAVAALYNRADLYAPTALEASPYCKPEPQGKVAEFSYTQATKKVTYLGTTIIPPVNGPIKSRRAVVEVESPAPGIYIGTAETQAWSAYRGLVVTLEAKKSGFIPLQLRDEGSTLYNRTVVKVQVGRNDIFFPLCSMRAWVNSPPTKLLRVFTPATDTVTSLHLISPYGL